jgi:hypothetical protein
MKKIKKNFFAKALGAFQRGTVVILCIIMAVGCISCVKQKNCDCERIGSFVYLEKSYKMKETACNDKEEKIVAHFYYDFFSVPNEAKEGDDGLPIKGYVPLSFRSKTPTKVRVCLKSDCGENEIEYVVGSATYSLKCIEREEE